MDTKKINFRDILQIIQTVILIALVVEVTLLLRDSRPPGNHAKPGPSEPKTIRVNMGELTKGAFFLGKDDARATLVVFNSFSCGYCAMARETLMKLAGKFPNDLRIVYKHFNRGGTDDLTSRAVECAGEQGRFREMYNVIFDKGARQDPRAHAVELGLNATQFNACVSSDRYKAKIEKDKVQGTQLGVRGTPSFILNDKLIQGNRPCEIFEQLIESELKNQ